MKVHVLTPKLYVTEPRGLLAREIVWHRVDQAAEAQARVTRHVWDEAGRSVADWDPRLWEKAATANSRKTPSLSGRALLDESVDSGWRLALSGADGQSVECLDGRGSYSRTDYDECLRPVSVTEKLIDAQPNVVERFTYGDASALRAEHNQCGRLIRHDDPAGTLCVQEFGLAGGVLIENRRFLQTDEQPDWPLDSGQRDALLEPGTGHTTTTVFDAAASLVCQTDAVSNRTEHLNTVDGLLRETRLKLANAEHVQTLISDLHYNPTGQLERERLGNGVISEKTYEPQSGRLTRIFSSRADNTVLQDLNYRYDPVGNVVEIEDAAQATRFFANQRIDPISRYRYDTLYQLIEATGREVSTGASYGPALPTLQNLPFKQNYKEVRTKSEPVVHANDVAMEQYLRVSRQEGFTGQLPSMIVISNVQNEGAKAVANSHSSGTDELMSAFLTSTQNGKSTKRILDDFGLKATRVETEFFGEWGLNIYIRVEPLDLASYDSTLANAAAANYWVPEPVTPSLGSETSATSVTARRPIPDVAANTSVRYPTQSTVRLPKPESRRSDSTLH